MAEREGPHKSFHFNQLSRLTRRNGDTEEKGKFGGLSNPVRADLAAELRAIAGSVRRIGTRRSATPFDLLSDKEDAADRLAALARRLEVA